MNAAIASPACVHCTFWVTVMSGGVPAAERVGNCRRYPPQTRTSVRGGSEIVSTGVSEWPVTKGNHWCGEFRES